MKSIPRTAMLLIGATFMALCGSRVSNAIGFSGFASMYVAGFAIGIVLICSSPIWSIRAELSELKAELAALKKE